MNTRDGISGVTDHGPQYGDKELGLRPVLIQQSAKSIEGTSFRLFNDFFPDDDACLQHVFDVRFGQGFPCFRCGQSTAWNRRKTRRSFIAKCCPNAQIFPLSGTIFHRTKIPLRDWFFLALNFTNSKTGFSSTHARRLLGMSQRTAFFMCDRIRTHLALLEAKRKIGGAGQHVYVDEALLRGVIGGKNSSNKIIILGLCTQTDLKSVIIPDRRAGTMIPLIEKIAAEGSILVTDSYASYRSLKSRGWHREIVNHSMKIYTNDNGVSQAQIETYWKHLKRSFRSTHLRIDRKNAWKYLNSFNFIYNRRHNSKDIFWDCVSAFPHYSQDCQPPVDLDPGYHSVVSI